MLNALRPIYLAALLSQCQDLFVSAQISASFQFPNQDGLTANVIDTVVLQWTSGFAQTYLTIFYPNETASNTIANFSVASSGSYDYKFTGSGKITFPVACYLALTGEVTEGDLAEATSARLDSPFGITFTSSPGLQAKTVHLNPSSSSPSTTVTIPASVITLASTSSSAFQIFTGPSDPYSSSVFDSAGLTASGLSTSSTSSGTALGTILSTASNSRNTINTGAIIGGVIGGLGLLCLTLFGTLILWKVQRNTVDHKRRRSTRRWSWWRFHEITEMQTGGLHEKEGTPVARYEKDGTPVDKKGGSGLMGHVEDDIRSTPEPVFELPAETRI